MKEDYLGKSEEVMMTVISLRERERNKNLDISNIKSVVKKVCTPGGPRLL